MLCFYNFSNPIYFSVTIDRSPLFEATVVSTLAKVGIGNHILRKLISMKLDA